MRNYINSISRPLFWLGIIILFGLSAYFFIIQLFHKPCCDASSYLEIATRYNIEGIIAVNSSLRTFAYPWLLSHFISISNLLNIPNILFIFLAQLFAYYCCVLYVSKSIFPYSQKLSVFIYIALCLNIFLIPYLGITLTDGLYTICSFLILIMLTNIENSKVTSVPVSFKMVICCSLLLGVAIAIRPAAIWLFIPYAYCYIGMVIGKKISFWSLSASVLIGILPLFFQATINVINYKVFTFFPIDDLGESQIRWGIENIKYATWLGDGAPPQNFYSSAQLINLPVSSSELKKSWYFLHPIDGFKLVFFKFIGAFDFDYLMPYPYKKPAIGWVASFVSFTILWLSLYGILLHLLTGKIGILGGRFFAIVVLISWGAISLTSALELRFTLPLITYFIVIGLLIIDFLLRKENKRYFLGFLIGWFLLMPIFISTANFVREQSVVFKMSK